MKNLAIFSPALNKYSETFIQNHTQIIKQNIYFYYGGFLPTQLNDSGPLQPSIIDQSIFILRSTFRKNLDYLNIIQSKNLFRSLIHNKINLVLAEYGPTGAETLGICKKAKIPLIVNFHGADASEFNILQQYKYKYIEMFNYVSAVIAVSIDMKNTLIKLGCPEHKIHYITYGPSDKYLDVNPSYDKENFLSIGRFVDKKSPYNLILAFNLIKDKYPNTRLYLGGDGPLLQTCKNLAKHLKLENNIIFCGVLNQNDIILLMNESLAYVQHSIEALNGDKEGTPVAILEAQAAGLPVIATQHAGISDIIQNGLTGFLVQENDIYKMSEYMSFILENKILAKEMGKNAKIHIQNNFSLKIHATKLNNLINQYI